MIAYSAASRRTMCAKGGTVTYTATSTTYTSNTYSSSDVSGAYIVVVPDNGWREVTVDDLETIVIKEPAQEQDEPNTGERPVYWERPHRRLATVTASRDRPRQLESTFG
jgi:hypothetical protein